MTANTKPAPFTTAAALTQLLTDAQAQTPVENIATLAAWNERQDELTAKWAKLGKAKLAAIYTEVTGREFVNVANEKANDIANSLWSFIARQLDDTIAEQTKPQPLIADEPKAKKAKAPKAEKQPVKDVPTLLAELEVAKANKDQKGAKVIRAALRRAGYRLSEAKDQAE